MVSLNDINQEADEKYGPFVVEDVPGGDVVLRNTLRLTRNELDQFSQLDAKIKAAQGDPNKVLDVMAEVFVLVSVGDGGKRLLDALGDDPPKLMHLLTLYREATQPGEALPSES
jgi:hypothetical protein